MDDIDFKLIERGKALKDDVENRESPWGFIYHQIDAAISFAYMAHCQHRYRPDVEPLDYKLGRLHGLSTFKEYVDGAIEDGAKEAIRFAENRENRPAAADGPKQG